MCFGNRSKVDESGLARSRELDKAIRADEKKMAKEVKLLLLGKSSWMFVPSEDKEPKLIFFVLATGAGESGKSTVLKQMKLIYAQGFSKNEKNEWKPVIFGNIVQSFRLIFDAMNEMGIVLENEENEASNSSTRHPIAEGIPAAARRGGNPPPTHGSIPLTMAFIRRKTWRTSWSSTRCGPTSHCRWTIWSRSSGYGSTAACSRPSSRATSMHCTTT